MKRVKKLLSKNVRDESAEATSSFKTQKKSFINSVFTKLNIFFLEALYKIHVRIRYVHDSAYSRGGWYKGYSDKDISKIIHKAGLATFVVSFIAFTAMQSLWPYFFTLKPRQVQAGQSTTTWNTQSEFESNSNTAERMANDGSTAHPNISWSAGDSGLKLNQGWSLGTETLMGNQSSGGGSTYANQNRHLVKTSAGTLVYFYYDGATGYISYKTSIDQGATWSAGTSTGVSTAVFSVDMDSSSNIHLVYSGNYRKLTTSNPTASPPTWTVGNQYSAASSCSGQSTSVNYSGNIIATSTKLFYAFGCSYSDMYSSSNSSRVAVSTDLSGTSWTSFTVYAPGGNFDTSSIQVAPYSSNTRVAVMFANTSGYLSWSNTAISSISWSAAATAISTAIIQDFSATSDGSNIYVATRSSGGIKYAINTSGGWSSYTTVTTGANDKSPAISYNGTDVLIFYMKYIGASQYHIMYRSSANWATENPINTNSNNKINLTVLDYDTGVIPIFWWDPYSAPNYPIKYSRYYSTFQNGTLGDTGTGLRLGDTTSGKVFKWAKLKFVGTISTGTGIQFQIRPSDSYGTGTYVNPSTNASGVWSTAIPVGTYAAGTPYELLISSNVTYSKTLEVKINATGGAYSPIIQQVSVVYDLIDDPIITSTTLSSASNGTIGTGSSSSNPQYYTKDTTVNVNYNTTGLTCTTCTITSNGRFIRVEAKPIGTAFDGTGTFAGTNSDNTNYYSVATVSGLVSGTSYHLRVRAEDGQGRVSNWVSFGNGSDAVTAATDLTVDTVAPTQSGVPSTTSPTTDTTPAWSWTASTDALSGLATSNTYKIYWDTVAGGTSNSAFSDTNSFTHSTPLSEGTWYVKVEAYDKAGNVSTVSSNGTVVIDATAPTSVTPSGYEDSSKVTSISSGNWYNYSSAGTKPYFEWSTASDANGIENYYVYFGTNEAATAQADGTPQAGTTFSPAGTLSNGSIYYLKVKAKDNAGNFSSTSGDFTYKFDNSAPSAVSGLSATEGNEEDITVTWTAYTDSGSSVTNYQIQRIKKSEYTSGGLTPTGTWTGDSLAQITCGTATEMVETINSVSGTGCALDSGTNISPSIAYYYRIRAKDTANPSDWGSWSVTYDQGLTLDAGLPSSPTGVNVYPCQLDGSTNCSGDGSPGFEMKIVWSQATDEGSGVARYKIWRTTVVGSTDENDYALIGVVNTGAPALEFYDNVVTNAATDGTYKTVASANLKDYGTYYYRVTAQDVTGNPSSFVPVFPLSNINNAQTPDVTDPTIGTISSVTATSITEIQVNWSAWLDKSSDGTINGSGVSSYTVERSLNGSTGWTAVTDNDGDNSNTQFIDHNYDSTNSEGTPQFQSMQNYYYRIKATDVAGNVSDYTSNSETSYTTSPDATSPSAPTEVNAVSLKGDPSAAENLAFSSSHYAATDVPFTSNTKVGHQITLTWKGSNDNSNVKGYKIYRSTTSPDGISADTWKAAAGSPLATVSLSGSLSNDETGVTYTYVDNAASNASSSPSSSLSRSASGPTLGVTKSVTTGLSDSTRYYYRVLAFDDNALALESSLSSPTTPSTRGNDITPDTTAPAIPEDVKIQAIWGANAGDIRNVITWKKVTTPTRNSTNDFKEYKLYKSTDNVTFTPITVSSANPLYMSNKTAGLEKNYYVDSDVLSNGTTYYYYVAAIDDAGEEFKYPSSIDEATPVINAYNNASRPSAKVSLNPSEVMPQVNTLSNGKKTIISNVGVSSATISWDTNQAADSVVEYRKQGDAKFITAGDTESVTSHSVTIKALEPGKPYEYRILSRNSIGNVVKVGYGQDDTNVEPLVTSSFSISHDSNANVVSTTTTATVRWTTSIDADSSIEYKKESNDRAESSSTAGDPALTKEHEVVIKALKPDTNYTYKIRSVTGDKYVSETQFLSFRTKPYDASQFTITPAASSVAEQNITATSAKIVWNTAVATTSWIDYGTAAGKYSQSGGNDNFNTVHVVELVNLTPGTTYYYRVRGEDVNEIEYNSKEYSFTAVLKPEISNVKVSEITPYSATVSFDANVDTTSFVGLGKDGNLSGGVGINNFQRNHKVKLENLEDQAKYSYQVTVKDKLGNEAKTGVSTFDTPLDTTGPTVKEVKIDLLPMGTDDEEASAIISWTTDKPATTQVEYDEGIVGNKYSQKTIADESLNRAHTVIVKELTPGSTYRFRIISKDKKGNLTLSQAYNFVTPNKEKSVLQLIIRSLEETFSWVKEVGTRLGEVRSKIFGR